MSIILRINDLSRSGPGVAREESGRVIFVPMTAPGDLVKVELLDEEKRYAEARLVEVLEPSPLRVEAKCPAFRKCGGCDWQHLAYDQQWRFKCKAIQHALQRVGLNTNDLPFKEIPADIIWHYRNRVQMRGYGDTVGFHARASRDIVPVDKCWIAKEEINAVLPAIREQGVNLPREYKVEVEVHEDGQVTQTWNRGHSAHGFRQVHNEQNTKLQTWVSEQLQSKDLLLDLFGGSGNLSLNLRERFSEIHCVDISSPEDESAGNFFFHRAAVVHWLRISRDKFSGRTVSVILDPPRDGLGRDEVEILEILKTFPAVEILSIGCEIDSWVRSLNRMLRYGWTVESLGALDFFPQTHHVECLAVLRRPVVS